VLALKKWQIKKLAVSHCTGFAAATRLKQEFPVSFQSGNVGYSIEI